MVSRIKSGRKRASASNPSFQDLAQALERGSARGAAAVAQLMTPARYQQVKRVMDAVAPMLPVKAKIAWEAVEVGHDIYQKLRRK